jgi:hypothetical protein
MLTTLSTVKSCLALAPVDTTYDVLLTGAINAVSSLFDREANRALARTANATYVFDPPTPKSRSPATGKSPRETLPSS